MAVTKKPAKKPAEKKPVVEEGVEEAQLTDKALTAKVFRPQRHALDAALDAVAGLDDGAEAWESLAARGMIPAEWVGESQRYFVEERTPEALVPPKGRDHPSHEGVRRYVAKGPAVFESPTSVACAVTLASDVRGVTTAELVARETVKRLAPWGCPQPTRVAWRVVDPKRWETQAGDWRHMPVVHAMHSIYEYQGGVRERARAGLHDFGTPAWRAAFTWECAEYWKKLVRAFPAAKLDLDAQQRAEAHGCEPIADALLGTAISTLQNPFEPLLSLWASGYALDVITAELIVLAAPRT